jgi:nucleotide-binding universal stress UspA family protein
MNVLVPVSENRQSLAAVDFVAARGALVGGRPDVVLLHAQWPAPRPLVKVIGHGELRTLQDRSAERVFAPALRELKAAKLAARAVAVVGDAGEQIAGAARKYDADLVVMVSRGGSAMRGLFFGSVTNAVLARSRVPLLVLRGRRDARPVRAARPKPRALRIAVAVDGTKYGVAAVRYLLRHRELFGDRPDIRLLHVVEPYVPFVVGDVGGLPMPAYTAADADAAGSAAFEAAMAPVRTVLRKAGADFEEVRLAGNPGDEIARYARVQRADLLVLGSHGRGAFTAALLGSVATRVGALCNTPLLIIRRS